MRQMRFHLNIAFLVALFAFLSTPVPAANPGGTMTALQRSAGGPQRAKSALNLVGQVERGAEAGDPTAVVNALKQLDGLGLEQVGNPMPVARRLLQVLGSQDSRWMEIGLKLLIAKQAHRFAQRLLLVATQAPGYAAIPAVDVQRHVYTCLDHAVRQVDETQAFSSSLRFELDCAKAVLDTMDSNGANPQKSRGVLRNLILLSTRQKPHGSRHTALRLYERVNHGNHKRWYEVVLVMESLKEKAVRDPQALKQLQRLIATHRGGDWHVTYAGADALRHVIVNSSDSALARQAYYGRSSPAGSLLPGLESCLHFRKNRLHNNRRVRSQVARSALTLRRHSNPKIAHAAGRLVEALKVQEKDKSLLLALKQPQLVPEVHLGLLRDWRVGESDYGKERQRYHARVAGVGTEPKQKADERLGKLRQQQQRLRQEQKQQQQVLGKVRRQLSDLEKVGSTSAPRDPEDKIRAARQRALAVGEEFQTLHHLYIPTRAARFQGVKQGEGFQQQIDRFLKSDRKVAVLLGPAGAGKSTFTAVLNHHLWQTYQPGGLIPVHIDLPAVQDPVHKLVEHTLVRAWGWTPGQLEQARKQRRFFFVLDGYDELNTANNLIVSNRLVKDFNAKVLITSRRAPLPETYKDIFAPMAAGQESLDYGALEEWFASPFNKEEASLYIGRYLQYVGSGSGWSADRYRTEIEKIPGLRDIVENPFTLKVVIEVLPEIVEKNQGRKVNEVLHITRHDLYTAYVNKLFRRQKLKLMAQGKLPRGGDVTRYFWRYFKELAREMYARKLTRVFYEPEADELFDSDARQNDKAIWERFFGHGNPLIETARTGGLLKKIPGGYGWQHASLYQFLVAEVLREKTIKRTGDKPDPEFGKLFGRRAARKKSKRDSSGLGARLLNDEVQVIKFLADLVKKDDKFKTGLWRRVEQSKRKCKGDVCKAPAQSEEQDEKAIAAANAMTVLNTAGVPFVNRNLAGARIAGANLNGALLDGVDFTGADLRRVSLAQASLAHAVLHKADMVHARFGEYTLFRGHADIVWSVSFSPDGRYLASASGGKFTWNSKELNWELQGGTDNTVRLWDVSTGQLLQVFEGHTRKVNSVGFSSDGTCLASAGSDKAVRLWDVSTGQLLQVFEGHTREVNSVSFSPDGTCLASAGSDKAVRLWDVSTGQLLQVFEGHTREVNGVSFSPDGHRFASASSDRTVRLWDVSTGQLLQVFEGHTREVNGVSFSPDGHRLASASNDQTVRLWDVSIRQLLKTFKRHTARVWGVSFSPDGCKLASASSDQTVRLWDVKTEQILRVSKGHRARVWSVSFSPDGGKFASASCDQTVRLWDVGTGRLLKILVGHTHWIREVAFSPDGRKLASAGDDQTIRLWDVSTGRPLKIFRGHTKPVWSISFSPKGRTLASASWDKTVRLWDVSSGQILKSFEEHDDLVNSVSFSPDGRKLASAGDDQTIRLWDVSTGQLLKILVGHTHWIREVAFSPNGRKLASAGDDQTIRLWNVSTGRALKVFRGHTKPVWGISFSLDGIMLASASSDRTVRLWSVDAGQALKAIDGHTHWVRSVVFSQDGSKLVSAGDDQTVRLWRLYDKHGKLNPTVLWIGGRPSLSLVDADFTGATGLTPGQRRLIKQRGGKVDG